MHNEKVQKYTLELTEALRLLSERRTDHALADHVAAFVGSVPHELTESPRLVLFRNIVSLTRETERLLELSQQVALRPLVFEYHEDMFYAGTIDKHILLSPRFKLGSWSSGRAKIRHLALADVVGNQGRSFADIQTFWSTPLVSFHHKVTLDYFPALRDNVRDLSDWLRRHGEYAREYYTYFLALFVRHAILLETYDYNEREAEFSERVIYPAFRAVESMFGCQPLIVPLSPGGCTDKDEWWMAGEDAYALCTEAMHNKV